MGDDSINILTALIGMIAVGLPVTVGLLALLLSGGIIVFLLLILSIVLISAPFAGGPSGPLSFLMVGLPPYGLMFFGLGFMCLTVIIFMGYLLLFKIALDFIYEMYKTIIRRNHL